jgi:hypothetical protein
MPGGVDVTHDSPGIVYDGEHVTELEHDRRHGQEVHGSDHVLVVRKEVPPLLTGCHLTSNPGVRS